MIDYEKMFEVMDITCDSCSESDSTTGDFQECIDHFKSEGWRITQDSSGYTHTCQSCQENELNELENEI